MIRIFALTACVWAALCSPAWAINKCTMEDGRVVYQETPCLGAGTKVNTSGAGQADPSSDGPHYYMREAAKLVAKENAERAVRDRIRVMSAAISGGQVVIGMTAEEARRSWGVPTKINTSIGSYGKHEQWVYPGHNYVYIENGVVTGAQTPQ